MKKLLFLLLLLTSTAHAQTQYCGADTDSILVAKQTLSNLALQSEAFDDVAHTKTNVTVTANSVAAPDGNTTADTVTSAAISSSSRGIYPTAAIAAVNGSTYRQSIYLKAGTHRYVEFYSQSPSTAFVDVDLQTCTVLRLGSTTPTYSVTSAKNGFCLIQFTYVQSGVVAFPTIGVLKDAVSTLATSWVSAGTEAFYAWGLSFQLASAPSGYVATTGSTATFGPTCPAGYSQSYRDPSRCYAVSTSNPLKLTPFTGSTSGTNINTSQAPLTPFRKP